MNEGKNIGHVLERLPEGLHEVILVDGNSKDDTSRPPAAPTPSIRVTSPERPRQGRRLPHRLRRRHRQPRRHARRRRLRRPGRDPPLRRRARGRRRLRQGLALPRRRRQRRHHLDPQLGNACLSGTANLLHGTHFTDLCYGYNAFWARCLPFISLDVPGLRGRDPDQPPHRRRRDEDHRGAELRGGADLTARATSRPSATASACSARSSASRAAAAASTASTGRSSSAEAEEAEATASAV